jgi:DNA-binding MarR family transcriptional regulator
MVDPGFGFEKPEHSPGFLLWQAMVVWQRQIKNALDSYDISHAQFVILANVLWFESVNQEPTQMIIARSTKLDKMTVSKSLKKLAGLGLVKRAEHGDDIRAKSVHLTSKGKRLASSLVVMVEKIDDTFFGVISIKNQKHFIGLLNEIISGNE